MLYMALLYFGIISTPFAFYPGSDMREIQMLVAFAAALFLGTAALYKGQFKPFRNPWFLALLAYIPISVAFSPAPDVTLVGINVSNFWAWKPLAYIAVFSVYLVSLSSANFQYCDRRMIMKVMVWCASFMALYVILQHFWIDQFFALSVSDPKGRTAGFIGNPTLVAPFIAMMLPMAFYLRMWKEAIVILAGALIPDSQIASGALLVSMVFYFGMRSRSRFITFASLMTILGIGLAVGCFTSPQVRKFVGDNERFIQWRHIANDIRNPLDRNIPNSYPLTGRGLGSFKYVYHIDHPNIYVNLKKVNPFHAILRRYPKSRSLNPKEWTPDFLKSSGVPNGAINLWKIYKNHPNTFHQAHNEYLEGAYNSGMIGLFLWIGAIVWIFKRSCFFGDMTERRPLLASFLCVSIAAGGTFVFQIGATLFYSLTIIGLLHNIENTGEQYA